MHQRFRTGSYIHDTRDSTVRIHETQFVGLDELIVSRDVGVAVHVGGESGGGVDGVEGHCVVEVGGPGAGAVGFDDRVAGGIVACYVVRESWEAVGDLGLVVGSGFGHDEIAGLLSVLGGFLLGSQMAIR